jgi:uncharacterized protein YkwD
VSGLIRKSNRWLRFALCLVSLSLLALTVWPARSQEAHALGGQDEAAAQRIIQQTNELRWQHRLPPLVVSQELGSAAQAFAYELSLTGRFDHTGQGGSTLMQRAEASGYGHWLFLAENLARGTGALDPDAVVDAWMASGGHRINMVAREASEIGVACFVVPGQRYLCVAEFGSR